MKKVIGFYNYTVILTYCGLLFALYGISSVMRSEYYIAVVCLMAAGLCDMFDGAVAATKKRTVDEKRFGIQIDSLCDLICFGVLPGIWVYSFFGKGLLVSVVSALYILCALIRLAYFNVSEEHRQDITDGVRETYLGVPVTTVALILPALHLIYRQFTFVSTAIFPAALFITAIAFITPVKIRKPHRTGKMLLLAAGVAEAAMIILQAGCKR